MKAKVVLMFAIAVIAIGYLHPALVKGQPKPERPVAGQPIAQDVPVDDELPFPESSPDILAEARLPKDEEPDDLTLVTRVFRLKHASAQDLANQIEKLYQIDGTAVAADVRTNQLTVRAKKQGMTKVLDLVENLDVPAAQDADPFLDSSVRTFHDPEDDGLITKRTERNVFAPADAQVKEVLVNDGQAVQEGQELLKLRSTDLDVQLTDIRGQIVATEVQILSTKRALLNAEKTARAAEKEELAQQVKESTMRLTLMKSQFDLLKKKKDELVVRSPIHGVVITQRLRENLMNRPVQRGQILLTVVAYSQNGGDAGRIQQLSEDPELAKIKAALAEAIDQLKEAERRTKNPQAPSLMRLRDRVRELEKQLAAYSLPSAGTVPTEAEVRASKIAAEYRQLVEKMPRTLDIKGLRDAKMEMGPLELEIEEHRQVKLAQLKRNLQTEVEAALEERQKSQTDELEQLRERLTKIEKLIEDRKKNRAAIINRRVDELINPNLRWDEGARILPPARFRTPVPSPTEAPASEESSESK